MSKNKANGQSEEVVEMVGANRTIKFSAFATVGNPTRRSYRIPGHPGCLVIERNLFLDGDGPDELVLSVDLVSPKASVKVGSVEKEAAKLAKAEERAQKAADRLAAQQEKALVAAAKAQSALDAAKAKVATA